jgi:hypothetical protein
MKRLFDTLVELVFWLQIFIAPVGIGGIVSVVIYASNKNLLWLSMVIFLCSIVIGVIYAERVRKKHGASRYASKILATPDIWPDEEPEETAEKSEATNSTK